MPPNLLACGSNAASHLAIGHSLDVSLLTPTVFHPSLAPIPATSRILDVVSTSAHSLLLLSLAVSEDAPSRNILLGAGTNTLGQLGPRCALWGDVKPQARCTAVDLVADAGVEGDWEPVKMATTWTTSIVVYQRLPEPPSTVVGEGSSSGAAASQPIAPSPSPQQIVLSCGSNDFGELGSTSPLTLSNTPSPIPISQPSQRPTVVDLGLAPGEQIELIKGGQRHVVAVISGEGGAQRVLGWGAARKGELDAKTISQPGAQRQVPSARARGKGKAAAPAPSPTSPPVPITLPLPAGERITSLALGAAHTLALLSGGRVLGWGSDAKGQLLGVHELRGVRGIAATWGGSYFLTNEGVLSQGSNTHSQLVRGQSPPEARGLVALEDGWSPETIIAGSEHLLVLARKGTEQGLWTGGWNEHGNLALGDQTDRDELRTVELGEGDVRGIWGGCASTWVWVDAEGGGDRER
ncbi:hypothetical protein IAT38_001575 [Cryptococcus sp. DSM 104549]